ncbi:PucR family transcriptional regulator [Nocardioides sp.]|uniref:PucR family transcriptional regulator n=1 Tax=Nocardioides sp. TaxID=35761 RepID=UPI003513C7EE
MSAPGSAVVDEQVREWLRAWARRLRGEAEVARLVALVDDAVVAEVPEVAATPELGATLEASTRSALLVHLDTIPDRPPGSVPASSEMEQLGRTLAAHGADLGVLLRAYRVGQRVIWQVLMAEIHDADLDPALRVAVLQFLWEALSRNLERVVDDVVRAHAEESAARLRGSVARRAAVLEAVLAGQERDAATVARLLDHPVQDHHVAAVLWLAPSSAGAGAEADATRRLEKAARALAERARARLLTTQPAADTLWAWFTGTVPPDPGAPGAVPGGVRVALGEPASGLAGLRASHDEAVRVRRLLDLAPAPPADGGVVRYRDVELASLLAEDPAALRRFLARTLGDLARDDDATARLRATVLAYLADGSSARAAARLHVHKNTVLYRLRQAEDLLGRSLEERRHDLETALRVHGLLGGQPEPPGPQWQDATVTSAAPSSDVIVPGAGDRA